MDNPSVNLRVDHLRTWHSDAEVAQQIQALQDAGLRVTLQVQEADGLQLLQQLPAVRARAQASGISLVTRLVLSALLATASIGVGLWHFLF